jgi:aminopeptidase N
MYDVIHYDLELGVDIKERSLSGKLTMTANSLSNDLDIIYINLYDNMNVSKVSYSFDENTPQNVSFTRENNYVIINPDVKPKNDSKFIVIIEYSGKPVNEGFDSFAFKDIYGSTIAYNLSEPNYGPTWWPSKDQPDDKTLFDMHITVPTSYQGVSNGKLIDSVQNNDNTSTFNWRSTYPIATYLVSIIAAKFTAWEDTYTSIDGTKQMPVVYYVFPKDYDKARIDWSATPEMIRFYSETFGEYPFIDEKYGMAQFGWTSGAMEHQTLTSMGYLLITGDNRYDNVVVHELAHHWFGDAVTLADWKNIWLNEGFATYSEALWVEYKQGKQAYLDYMKDNDFGYFSGTVYAPEGFIDDYTVYATVYQKGGWVLHMLRGVIGDSVFFDAVKDYYETYKYKNATTEELVNIFEKHYGQDLDWFFDQWVYKGKSRPKYEYSWKFEDFQDQKNTGAYTVRLNIKQVQTDYDVYRMPIRITIITESDEKEFTVFNDQKDQSFLLTINSKPKEVRIDKDGWILKKVAKAKYDN